MKFNLDPITWDAGQDNMGGYKAKILFIPESAVSATPLLPKNHVTDADLVTATGAFVFKTVGDKPKYIKCTDGTVKYDSEAQGEVEGGSFIQKGEYVRAGAKKDVASHSRGVINTPGYLVLEDMEGQQIMVGQPDLPCIIKPSYSGGQKRADRRESKFTFSCDSFAPIVYLAVPIDMDALLKP